MKLRESRHVCLSTTGVYLQSARLGPECINNVMLLFNNPSQIWSYLLIFACVSGTYKAHVYVGDSSRNASRLAISMLLTSPRLNDSKYGYLRASLNLYTQNLLPHTPADLFIFSLSEHVENIKRCLIKITASYPNVMIVTIPAQQWSIPEQVSDETQWRLRRRFSWGYRMMGDWRLTHQMR